jgi:hypothetical protein
MNPLDAREVRCPYCYEVIELSIDCSVSSQRYIEDCQVCCRPINVSIHISELDTVVVRVTHENE